MSEPYRRKTGSMLKYVVDAIAKLNDPHGSNTQNIVRHINCTAANKLSNGRNGVTVKVRKALKQGSESGVLLHLAGKYKLLRRQKNKNLAKPLVKPKSTPHHKKSYKKARSGKVQSLRRETDFSSRKTACCKKNRRRNKQRQKSSARKRRCNSLVSENESGNNGNDSDRKPSSQSVTKSDNGNTIMLFTSKLEAIST